MKSPWTFVQSNLLAKTANTPEDRLRYAQAVQQLKTEVLPKMQKEMEELGKKLGLKDGEIGKALKLESDSVFGLNIKRQQNGLFSLVTTYEKGMFYHNKSWNTVESRLNVLAHIWSYSLCE